MRQILLALHFNPVLAPIVGALAFISVLVTYYLIANIVQNPIPQYFQFLEWLLLLDLILFLFLTALIAYRLVQFGRLKKSKLQSRIVLMFSLVGMVPTVVVSIFSTVFLNYGVKAWFDERVETALVESVKVAEAYLEEYIHNLVADAQAMSYDISSSMTEEMLNTPNILEKVVSTQANLRGLFEFAIFRQDKILIKSYLGGISEDELSKMKYKRADSDQVVLTADSNKGKVRALTKLKNFGDTYLLIGKLIDNRVLHHLETTKGANYAYKDLKNNISLLQLQSFIAFILVSLLLLLASIWAGIVLSGNVANPISNLVEATNRIRTGDLGVEVTLSGGEDEISDLESAFNQMAAKLHDQREQLVKVNGQINERRIFIETVISNLSSGVIVVDNNCQAVLINNYAKDRLKLVGPLHGMDIVGILPELADLITINWEHRQELFSDHEVSLVRDNATVNLLVRMVWFYGGCILAFDDITKLVNAQKAATWADLARKIAHEIKNPITPIYLAAHRLKRLYLDEEFAENSKSALVYKYVDTIERNSSNLRRIVDEFANFARMPMPIMSEFDVAKLLNAAVFSQQVADNGVIYNLSLPQDKIIMIGDAGQIELVLQNILKNASQAILEFSAQIPKQGQINIELTLNQERIIIAIFDNGPGFKEDLLDKLLEPYITTRANGTGLGLAISKKIINEHNGEIELCNIYGEGSECLGAKVKIAFPSKRPQQNTTKERMQNL